LQRGAVTAATAPMIVMQTVVPALLGIAVLGDMVRSGWLIGAGFGFVATVAGAVTLARYEGLRAERHSATAASSPAVDSPVAGWRRTASITSSGCWSWM